MQQNLETKVIVYGIVALILSIIFLFSISFGSKKNKALDLFLTVSSLLALSVWLTIFFHTSIFRDFSKDAVLFLSNTIPNLITVFVFSKKHYGSYIPKSLFQRVSFKALMISILLGINLKNFFHLFWLCFSTLMGIATESEIIPINFYSILSGIAIAPFLEEIIFRGFFLDFWTKGRNKWMAIAVSSLLFSLLHLSPHQFFYLVLTGVLYCTLRIKGNSLWVLVAAHSSGNFAYRIYSGIDTVPFEKGKLFIPVSICSILLLFASIFLLMQPRRLK